MSRYVQLLTRLMAEAEPEAVGGAEPDVVIEDAVDDKTADDKTDDEPEADLEQKDNKEIPEAYTFEMPEGVELDEKLANEFSPIMKDLGLTNEQANKLAAKLAEVRMQEGLSQFEEYNSNLTKWENEVKADKELGGNNFDNTSQVASLAVEKLGSPELIELLDNSGLGSHPALVRFSFNAGKLLKEDDVSVGEPSPDKKDTASRLYPNE